MKDKILVSACLLGRPCRYDGLSKPCPEVLALSVSYELIPVCPEKLGGLATPRHPCEIVGDRIIRSDGRDMTEPYRLGAERTLQIAEANQVKFCVLKEKSPSCGKRCRYDGTFTGKLVKYSGITASLLSKHHFLIYSEDDVINNKNETDA